MGMHILYIHQYFATPAVVGGGRSYEFARRWVKQGHKVTMLTSTCMLTERELANATGWLAKKFTVEGVSIIAACVTYKQYMGFLRRVRAFLSFIIVSSLLILFIKKVDVIYATSTPLTVGMPALVAKWVRRIPFVFEVRDHWPEALIEMGIIKNRILAGILLRFEKTIYKYCSAIVALSPSQAESVRRVLTEDRKVIVVPNCSDTEMFRPDIDGSATRRQYGWGEKFVLLHAGTMGKVNSLGFVIEAAAQLVDYPEILFVLFGQGSEKPVLRSRIKELGLTNVEILPALPRRQLPEVYAAVDVGLVIIGDWHIVEHNSANKFFDSLSAGKPVLLNYSDWQGEVLEENNAGFGCGLCNLDEFVEKVLYLNSHREELLDMSRNARRVAVEKFNTDKLAVQALEVATCIIDKENVASDSKKRSKHLLIQTNKKDLFT